jgi:hypothetical protein
MNGHEWINKMLGIPVPAYPFLNEGKNTHRLIQRHVAGIEKHPFLKHIEIEFPIVEEKDFDERCKFSFNLKELKGYPNPPVKEEYEIFGFADGLDGENGRLLEIKSSSTPWSMTKFRDAMQRKIYALAFPDFTEAYLITGSKDPAKWEKEPPKLYSVPLTKEDREEAYDWIVKGIQILESGDFKGGLDEEGFCTGCFWNMARYPELANCPFMRK